MLRCCLIADHSERGFIVIAEDLFHASTGETVTLNRPLPRNGDEMHGGNTSEKLGFAYAKHAVAESKEGNNELYVTAKCKDGDD